jgi:ubiquinol-cytochrome c reductase cytochrome b subunit
MDLTTLWGFHRMQIKLLFFPYFFIKDTLGLVGGLLFFSFFVYYSPNSLGHPDNYIPANPMSTPEHIVPE